MKDIYGRTWRLHPRELCAVCGQPDNCGDCTHGRLTDAEVEVLRGIVSTEENTEENSE